MKPIAETMKHQLTQLNESIAQLTKASLGLVVVVSEEGKKQFSDLVKAGEAQQEQGINLLDQVKNSIPESLDVKTSAKTLGLAARGLFSKAKANSEELFTQLVALGSAEAPNKIARKTTTRKAA